MIALKILFVTCSMLSTPPDAQEASIAGIVRNKSRGGAPAPGVEVLLRVNVDGQFVIAAETTTDSRGEFLFGHLPAEREFLYLPGASNDGVHYPGRRVRLTPERPDVRVELEVYDTVAEPDPLVIRRHDVSIRPEPGVLRVTETMLVANPTSACYVGQAAREDVDPVTLQLAIPPDFVRISFHEEFFGRRFQLTDGKLVTAIPWPPGERELKFTYQLPNEARSRVWLRPLDLPCSHVRVCVLTDGPEEVSCNLPPASEREGEKIFELSGRVLPAQHVVRLEIGRLPVPWMAYGRWSALVALLGLVVGTSLVTIRRKRRRERQSRPTTSASGRASSDRSPSPRRERSTRHKAKRRASSHRLR